jgi:hypothetical protein
MWDEMIKLVNEDDFKKHLEIDNPFEFPSEPYLNILKIKVLGVSRFNLLNQGCYLCEEYYSSDNLRRCCSKKCPMIIKGYQSCFLDKNIFKRLIKCKTFKTFIKYAILIRDCVPKPEGTNEKT